MLRKVITDLTKHGRRAVEKIVGLAKTREPQIQVPKEIFRTEPVRVPRAKQPNLQPVAENKTILSKFFSRGVAPNLAQELRNSFQFRMNSGSFPIFGNYRGLGQKLSLFGFVTVGMSSWTQQQEAQMGQDAIYDNIRAIFAAKTKVGGVEDAGRGLADDNVLDSFEFGPMIAKGCSAAVYQAKYRVQNDESESDIVVLEEELEASSVSTETSSLPPQEFDTQSDITVIDEEELESVAPQYFSLESDIEVIDESDGGESDIEVLDEEVPDLLPGRRPLFTTCGPGPGSTSYPRLLQEDNFDLAIKMMFNYDVESVASAIWHEMENELVPAKMAEVHQHMGQWQNGNRAKKKRLPPHPNIVEMHEAFVGEVPQLSSAFDEYPDALPERINPEGYGRNKTLFIVMKRYSQTLREYIDQQEQPLPLHHSLLLFTQLIEAVVHMQKHGMAHRDLKSDNILVEVDAAGQPHLVVTDFGCCMQEGSFGLRVPYLTIDTCKGGNGSLMAPEIACATPGMLSWLDYNHSDLWAAGTIAYEIFGATNPFYRGQRGERLDSATYTESQLPPLPDYVPQCFEVLVHQILARNAAQRPSAVTVANTLQMMLWAPESWSNDLPCNVTVRRWLLTLSAKVICQMTYQRTRSLDAETSLQVLMLSRLTRADVDSAVKFLIEFS